MSFTHRLFSTLTTYLKTLQGIAKSLMFRRHMTPLMTPFRTDHYRKITNTLSQFYAWKILYQALMAAKPAGLDKDGKEQKDGKDAQASPTSGKNSPT